MKTAAQDPTGRTPAPSTPWRGRGGMIAGLLAGALMMGSASSATWPPTTAEGDIWIFKALGETWKAKIGKVDLEGLLQVRVETPRMIQMGWLTLSRETVAYDSVWTLKVKEHGFNGAYFECHLAKGSGPLYSGTLQYYPRIGGPATSAGTCSAQQQVSTTPNNTSSGNTSYSNTSSVNTTPNNTASNLAWEGTYNLTQEFSAGRKAEAKLKITRSGDALRLEWDGGARVGLGLPLGDSLAVAFGGPECGVVAYERRGSTFSGAWTTLGHPKGTETFIWDGQKAARTNVTGVNPDGSTYKGQLLLGVQEEFSVLEWQIGKDVTPGIGLLNKNFFAVAFGAKKCAVGLYKIQQDGSLNGRFFQGEEHPSVPLREVATRQ